MATFDERAAEWDSNASRRAMTLALADAIVAHLDLKGGETVLDYGAGTGILALKLQPHVARIIAADASRGMLDVLTGKLATLGATGIETMLLDLERDDDVPPNADIVVSTMTLHHVKDVARLARKLFALLHAGGKIALADLETESGDFHDDMTGVYHRGFDRAALVAQFSVAGFVKVEASIAYVYSKARPGGVTKDYPIVLLTGEKRCP
jgi:cyclopropane fatty-acyl-phospholipid synthase-like methyltransferase